MKDYYSRYLRFLGTVFFSGTFLWIARKLGFDFALDLAIFFEILFLLFLILIIGEIKKRRVEICFYLKDVIFRTKNKLLVETKIKQEEIISRSPKIMVGKVGLFLTLLLAAGYVLLRSVWKILKDIFVKNIFSRRTIFLLTLFGILADVFVFDFISIWIILVLTGMWIWSVRQFKFEGKLSMSGGLMFLTMCPILLVFKMGSIAGKSAIWAYMFLIVGTCQIFIEDFRKDKSVAKEERK